MPNPENIKGQGFHTNPDRINRTGLNKGSRHRSTIAREWLETKIERKNPVTGQVEEAEIETHGTLEVVNVMLNSESESAKMQAYEKLMDSAYGKPNQPVEQTNIEGVTVIVGGEEQSESPTT